MMDEYFNCSARNRGQSSPVHSMLYWLEPVCPCVLTFSQLTSMRVFAVTAFLVVVWFMQNLLYYSPVVNPLWFPPCILASTPHVMLHSLRERSVLSSCSMYKNKSAVISAEFLLKFLGVLDAASHPEPTACVNPSIVLNLASHILSTLLTCLKGLQSRDWTLDLLPAEPLFHISIHSATA